MTVRITLLIGLVLVLVSSLPAQTAGTTNYYPDRFDWQKRRPEQVGLNPILLDQAVKFAIANESTSPRDTRLAHALGTGAREPFDEVIGPMKERGSANGLVIRKGYVAAEWGETVRVDMTYSVTKTFLSTVVGIAWQRGLIRDVNDPVRRYMPPEVELFETPHNRSITWDHLLRQTSDWQGTLWGKPDWADRPEGEPNEWANRKLHDPGTRYKYNDVRMNVLTLATLHILRRPLPEVLRDEVMEPIGASSTWRWYGYENSWVELDGRRIQSVTGGGHWGGGMFINAWDMARFGYLFLRNGKWGERQIVSEQWIEMARRPGVANPDYGYANWFLNADLPAATNGSVTFRGAGDNIIYIDWKNDIVAVVRWIDRPTLNTFIEKLLASVESRPSER